MGENYLEKPTFWEWIKKNFTKEVRSKAWKNFMEFCRFPMWEMIVGIFLACFSFLWYILPFLALAVALAICQAVLGILLVLHGAYRERYTYDC